MSDDIHQLLSTLKEGIYFGSIPETIYVDLGDLAAGLKPSREDPTERIFSMNMGIAVDDMVTARLVCDRARERSGR